ncbi:MAG: hypothetical protein CL432_07480 [Acidimicrobiaceae bacterium]|nr:hypothetical protein [Acidimicrobiaceae bacterium]HJO40824.1 DUF3566 domain-containing protein [Acidimicrobiales bacterium]
MSEKEDDFFDKTESQNFPVITMTTRLKKLIGKSDESEKTRESSVVKNSEEIIWNSEKASSRNKVKFWNSIREKESKPKVNKSGYRVRKVRRVLRHIEPWSALKVGLIFYTCVWGLSTIAVRILWNTAEDAGTIQKVESFIEDLFALEVFEFDSEQILRIFFLGGLILVVGGTAITVVLVVLFNLISDLTGGVRFTMIEEETAVRKRKFKSDDNIYEERKNPPT